MERNTPNRRREVITATALAVVSVAAVLAFGVLVGGVWFVYLLLTVGLLALLWLTHYLLWGRWFSRRDRARQAAARPEPPPGRRHFQADQPNRGDPRGRPGGGR